MFCPMQADTCSFQTLQTVGKMTLYAVHLQAVLRDLFYDVCITAFQCRNKFH